MRQERPHSTPPTNPFAAPDLGASHSAPDDLASDHAASRPRPSSRNPFVANQVAPPAWSLSRMQQAPRVPTIELGRREDQQAGAAVAASHARLLPTSPSRRTGDTSARNPFVLPANPFD